MDPLTLTLAAISLATTLRSVYDFAIKIKETFEKSARSLGTAREMAADIFHTIELLKAFIDKHHDVLCTSDEMKQALLGVLQEMVVVYDRCCQVIPIPANKTRDKLKSFVRIWRKRDDLERLVRGLQNRINKCYSHFMMFTMMRIEVQMVHMSVRHAEVFAVARREITNSQVDEESVITFIGGNLTILSKLPPRITGNFISDTYLRLQINTIDEYLTRLSSGNSYALEDPLDLYLQPFEPLITSQYTNLDNNLLRQDIIEQTLTIQRVLRTDSDELSIQRGAWDMVNLTIGLFTLEMYQEAATMGLWTVNLFRTLVRLNPDVYSPYLVHALRHLCKYYTEIDNIDGALAAITECIVISRRLQAAAQTPELKVQLAGALSTSASVKALKGDLEGSVANAEESVRIFDNMLGSSPLGMPSTRSTRDIHRWAEDPEWFWGPTLQNISHKATVDFGRSLFQLSNSLKAIGKLQEALIDGVHAAEILKFMHQWYPNSSMDLELADYYLYLCHPDFRKFSSNVQSLWYAHESGRIYRRCFERDRKRYGHFLCYSLWEEASILSSMEEYDAALTLWKEIAEISAEVMTDQLFYADALDQLSLNLRRLKRHEEAVSTRTKSVQIYQSVLRSTSATEAHAYYDLSVEYQLMRNFSKAAEAIETAVHQYRALAYKDSVYLKNLANALAQQIWIQINLENHDHAFSEGHEALKIYETLIKEEDVLSAYVSCLKNNSYLCTVSDNQDKAVERSEHIIYLTRQLVKQYPEQRSTLIFLITDRARMFAKFNRLPEGTMAIQEVLDWFENHPADNTKSVEQHISSLIELGSLLDNQGYTERACAPISKGIEVGKPFSYDPLIASLVLGCMHRQAQLLVELSRFNEAVVAAEEGLMFARSHKLENVGDFIGSLHVAAMAYKFCGRSPDAIAACNEAIQLCESSVQEFARTRVLELLHYPQCLHELSESLGDIGRELESLEKAEKAAQEAFKLKDRYATLSWIDIEPTYRSAQANLAVRLLAHGDFTRALEIVAQARQFYEEYSQNRSGSFSMLSTILHTEAIIQCAAGYHEDGASTRASLNNLKKRLRLTFPSLADLVEEDLRKEISLPSWKNILRSVNLSCGHQDD